MTALSTAYALTPLLVTTLIVLLWVGEMITEEMRRHD